VADRFAERLPRPLRRVLARARPDVPPLTRPGRSARFRTASHNRFWWHRLRSTDYVPPLYAGLSLREWAVVQGWFAQTGRHGRMVAEINVPAMSVVTALVAGNGIRRVVQLGHHYGYSALLLGFTLRAMGARPGLFTIDIDPAACEFTRRWLAHAGLCDHVVVREGASADPRLADDAAAVLGGPPEVVLVDSSHAYSHTLASWTCGRRAFPSGASSCCTTPASSPPPSIPPRRAACVGPSPSGCRTIPRWPASRSTATSRPARTATR